MSTNANPRRLDALLVYLVLEGASSLFFQLTLTIYVVFYATTVGLDALQIVLVGTVFEATIFLFEIPTGVVADVYSRRLSVIIGFGLLGAGLLLQGVFPVFGVILLAEVVAGIGVTFTSGATEAWITDEIGVGRAGEAFVRAAQVRTICALVGIAGSVALASVRLSLPFVVAGALLMGLALFLAIFMPERGFQRVPKSERTTWQTLFGTFREGVRLIQLRPVLIPILLITFVFAFHSEGFDLLWQKHILDNFILPDLGALEPVAWFGIISMGASLLSLGLNEIVRRRVDLSDHAAPARALMAIYGVMVTGILVFSLTGMFWLAVVAYWLVVSIRTAGAPVSKAWLNQSLEPRIRATMFSLSSQVNSVGEIFGGLPIGAVGKWFSLRAALGMSSLILALALPLLAIALNRQSVEAALVDE